MVEILAPPDEIKAVASGGSICPSCQGRRFIRHGLDRNGGQRWKCTNCGRTSINFVADRLRQAGIRIDSAKSVNFLLLIGKGLSLRKSADATGIARETGVRLVRSSGFVRKCRACGSPLTGNRFAYCSDGCQFWRSHRGAYDGTANVLRYIEDNGCSDHVRLAIAIATEISERNMDEYLGPVYEGLEQAHAAGITDMKVLRNIGFQAVKKHWSEILTFRTASIEAMKDAHGFEPSRELGDEAC